MMEETEQFHWYEDISGFPSQCYYYFQDPKTGLKYCIYLRIRSAQHWTCELVGCAETEDDDFDLDWNLPAPNLYVSDKFIKDDYPALEVAAQKAVAKMFPHIPELRVMEQDTQTKFPIQTLERESYDFPKSLLSLETDCPSKIYFKGTKGWIASGCHVTIIGARDATAEECKLARQLGRLFSSDIVVSGLARGIDTAAHQGSVEVGGVSVAVVATGLDKIYPKENADLELAILQRGGMIVSEYPEGIKANPTRLIARTRLQMAIADKVIVVACEKESGTMYAVDWTIKLGKPIFAIDNARSGNRYLIDSRIATVIALKAAM